MRVPTILAVCFISMAALLTGCAKKPADSTPPPATPVETPAPRVVPSETANPAPAPVANPLDEDLDAVNRYVAAQGLIGDVYYDYDRDELREESRSRLRKNAEFMNAQPQFVFTVEGHCDERGSIEYNLALGSRRAAAAKNYLSSLGVADGRMQTVTYGEESAVCTESSESCWSLNRRAHFAVTDRR